MSFVRFAACAATTCALGAAPSFGAVFFSFADENVGLEVTYTAPGVQQTSGGLSYDEGPGIVTAPVFTFIVDARDEGGQLNEFNATLEWDFEVGAIQGNGQAPVTGTFVFRDADADESEKLNGSDVILSGDFGEGFLAFIGPVGSVASFSSNGLTYEVGPVLTAADPVVTDLESPYDGVYTLTNVQFETTNQPIDRGDSSYFPSFRANAAFTGTAFAIPTPGAAALLGAAGLAGVRRRRS